MFKIIKFSKFKHELLIEAIIFFSVLLVINTCLRDVIHGQRTDEGSHLAELFRWSPSTLWNTDMLGSLFLYFYFPFKKLSIDLIKLISPIVFSTAYFCAFRILLQNLGIPRRYSIAAFIIFFLQPHVYFFSSLVLSIHFEILGVIFILLSMFNVIKETNLKSLFALLFSLSFFNLAHVGFSFITILFCVIFLILSSNIPWPRRGVISIIIILSLILPSRYDYFLRTLTNKAMYNKFSHVFVNYNDFGLVGKLDYDYKKSQHATKSHEFRNIHASTKPLDIKNINSQQLIHFAYHKVILMWFHYVWGPSLSEIDSIKMVYIFMISKLRVCMFALLICQYIREFRDKELKFINVILYLYVSMTLIYAYGTVNYGTALRHNIASDLILFIATTMIYLQADKRISIRLVSTYQKNA